MMCWCLHVCVVDVLVFVMVVMCCCCDVLVFMTVVVFMTGGDVLVFTLWW